MAANQKMSLSMLRRTQVEQRTGLSKTTIYAKLRKNPKRPKDYDPTFPRPVHLGAKAVAWIESEIDAWLAARVENSRCTSHPGNSSACASNSTPENRNRLNRSAGKEEA